MAELGNTISCNIVVRREFFMTVKKLDIFFFMKSDYNDELIQLNIHIALHLYLQIMSLLEQIRKGI